ncbi:MAG: SAM-dependent methyltransferase [Rhodobacteraceae bacterium]|nr:SAM-dependent methyltransferase [Paracoccaceae bacterium]
MTPLGEILIRRIAATGPISIAEYMAECLMHPVHGYYTTRDPLGREGDFTTAPEISQMFGELIGLAMAQAWVDQGRPSSFVLTELGPGRGTLMADLLRAAALVPGFRDAASLHLVEGSPVLRTAQAQALAGSSPNWHMTVETLPDGPLFLVANEFFDALPIRQFQRDPSGWRERQIAVSDGKLMLGLAMAASYDTLSHRLADTGPGEIVETCTPGASVAAVIAGRIARWGGAALIIDYGGWHSRGDTFQAISAHGFVDPLAEPGSADLTAHVDFEALAGAVRSVPGTASSAMTAQGVFLEGLGITARAEAIARRLSGPALDSHVAAHRRLTHPEEMGSLFQCLSVTPASAPPFPGLGP